MIKRLVRRTADWLELEQFNPAVRFRLPIADVRDVHRVPSQAELFGN